jgi:ketose-bisphosphate aldolase
MIDASHLKLSENIYLTKQVVEMARSENILVEGELGQIGGEEDGVEALNTMKVHLEDVRKYIDATGIDLLAAGIGNKHGYYEDNGPKLDFALLQKVRDLVPNQLLVLHGGTGIPDEDIRQAIQMGIHKINISTELKDTYLNAFDEHQHSAKRHNMVQLVDNCIESIKKMVLKKIHLFAGRES